jgi:SAM-dependent methyltransferase
MDTSQPKDLFSEQAKSYSLYRPSYPPELINAVLEQTPGRERAWDVATGNGQAALLLAPHFQWVEATDSSVKQLEQAQPAPNIHFQCAPAEKPLFAAKFFDLVVIAQAYHWLDPRSFREELNRVLRPGGCLAIWGYQLPQLSHPPLQNCLMTFYREVVGPYWDPERFHVDEAYEGMTLPLEGMVKMDFRHDLSWSLADLKGYLATWSSVQHYRKALGKDPVDGFARELDTAWPASAERLALYFPIFLYLGRHPGP